jgi:FAD/FMN-containing dehydrogenase
VRRWRSRRSGATPSLRVDRAVIAFITDKRSFPDAYAKVGALLQERLEKPEIAALGLSRTAFLTPYGQHAVYGVFSVLYDPDREGAREYTAALATDAYALIATLGAHPEPHQGIAGALAAEAWSPEVRRFVEGLKRVADPKGTLNPGLWGIKC